MTCPLQVEINYNNMIGLSGTLTICAKEMKIKFRRFEEVELLLCCTNFENIEIFSKSNVFDKISKLRVDGTWTLVY